MQSKLEQIEHLTNPMSLQIRYQIEEELENLLEIEIEWHIEDRLKWQAYRWVWYQLKESVDGK